MAELPTDLAIYWRSMLVRDSQLAGSPRISDVLPRIPSPPDRPAARAPLPLVMADPSQEADR